MNKELPVTLTKNGRDKKSRTSTVQGIQTNIGLTIFDNFPLAQNITKKYLKYVNIY